MNPLSLLADLVLDMLLPPGEGPGAGAGRLGVGGRALIVEEFACDELILAAGLALSLLTSGSLSLRSLNLGIRLKRLASLSLVVGERPDDLGLSSSSFLLSVEGSVLTEPCSDFLTGEAAMTVSEEDPSWSVLSSSSVEMVELQSDPTVMLDSGLSPSTSRLATSTSVLLVTPEFP